MYPALFCVCVVVIPRCESRDNFYTLKSVQLLLSCCTLTFTLSLVFIVFYHIYNYDKVSLFSFSSNVLLPSTSGAHAQHDWCRGLITLQNMDRRAITYIIINKKNRSIIYYTIKANYTSQGLS